MGAQVPSSSSGPDQENRKKRSICGLYVERKLIQLTWGGGLGYHGVIWVVPELSLRSGLSLNTLHWGTNVDQKRLGKDVFTATCPVPSVPTDPKSWVLRDCEAISNLISLVLPKEQIHGDPRDFGGQISQKATEV